MERKRLLGAGLATLIGIIGCDSSNVSPLPERANVTTTETKIKMPITYFAEIDNTQYHDGSVAITSGDFDGDGDLDFIVACNETKGNSAEDKVTRIYLFKNDGKGNFYQD